LRVGRSEERTDYRNAARTGAHHRRCIRGVDATDGNRGSLAQRRERRESIGAEWCHLAIDTAVTEQRPDANEVRMRGASDFSDTSD
jgi:hypothetical protein